MLARGAAATDAAHGPSVNVVATGLTETPLTGDMLRLPAMREGAGRQHSTSVLRLTRRALPGAVALRWLSGCSTPLPLGAAPTSDPAAVARLQASAQAHGMATYRGLHDINIGHSGRWPPLRRDRGLALAPAGPRRQ